MKLRCLSIRAPFAGEIMAGTKVEECRSWQTHHRGPLAIHSAGRVVGVVEVVDCLWDAFEGWVWLLANPRALKRPLPMKGRLGLFPIDLPDDLLTA